VEKKTDAHAAGLASQLHAVELRCVRLREASSELRGEHGLHGAKALGFGNAASSSGWQRKSEWILRCLQGGRAHNLAACGVATHWLSTGSPALLEAETHVLTDVVGGARTVERRALYAWIQQLSGVCLPYSGVCYPFPGVC
jgi:hypothetical protein